MDQNPSFNQFAEFVRQWAGLSPKKRITPDTKFEDDLGITGDDGCELMEATQKKFGVLFSSDEHDYRKAFQLEPDEFLFHGEGFSLNIFKSIPLFRDPEPKVRAFTVGELHRVVQKSLSGCFGSPSSNR